MHSNNKHLLILFLLNFNNVTALFSENDYLVCLFEKLFTDHTLYLVYDAKDEVDNFGLIFSLPNPKIIYSIVSRKMENSNDYLDTQAVYFLAPNSLSDLKNCLEVLSKNPNWNNKLYHLIMPGESIGDQQIKFLLKIYEIYAAIILKQKHSVVTFTTYPHKYRKRLNATDLCTTDFKFLETMSKRVVGECSFKMIWSVYPGLTKNPYTKENPGLMVRLLNTVANIMNCTPDYAKEANSLVVKEHTERKKLTQLTKYVIDNKVDIISNLYGPSVFLFKDNELTMSLSAILTMESYWLVPMPKPFEGSQIEEMVNTKVVAGLLICIILWRLSARENFWASVWAITMILSQQTVKTINTPTRRVLFMAVACGVMRFFMEYSTKLISSLTVPMYPNSPKNLQDLLKLDYKFAYPTYVSDIMKNHNLTLWKMLEDRHFVVEDDCNRFSCYNMKRWLNTTGIVILIDNLRYYDVYNPQDLNILPEVIATSHLCFMMRKNFPFTDRVNDLVLQIIEKGLTKYWLNQYHLPNKYEVPSKEKKVLHRTIQLKHLKTCFYFLLFGYALSFVVFVLELGYKYKKMQHGN